MQSDQIYSLTPDKMRDIQHEKGAPFTIKFIQWFNREWTGVVLAAQKIKGKMKIDLSGESKEE